MQCRTITQHYLLYLGLLTLMVMSAANRARTGVVGCTTYVHMYVVQLTTLVIALQLFDLTREDSKSRQSR